MPTSAYGSSLPTISSQRRERRDVQLLERAELLLAHDRHRRQVGRDHQQQQRDDAGDHEVAALEPRVEPDAHARLDAAGGPCTAPPAPRARRQLLRVAGDQRSRRSPAPRSVEFASLPSATTCTVCRPARRERRRRSRAESPAPSTPSPLSRYGSISSVLATTSDDREVRRRVEPADQLAARGDRSASTTTIGTFSTSVVAA